MPLNFKPSIAITAILLTGLACNFPGLTGSTPFVLPTPDLTITALFNPTPIVELTPTQSFVETETPVQGVESPIPTNTEVPSIPTTVLILPTAAPTSTPRPTQSFAGPGMRQEFSVAGVYVRLPLSIDGKLGDWGLDAYPINYVVYGADRRNSPADLSGSMMVAWDEDYLYVGVRVKDDTYVQNAKGVNLFKGDSIELLLDTDVSEDYFLRSLNEDDYQMGISPGLSVPGENPEAYLWFPRSIEGTRSKVNIGAQAVEGGYHVEAAIPWTTFGVKPIEGRHFGFAVSISDNDKSDQNVQQSMVSNVSTRRLTDPTTWGDLTLVKP